ncbi:MAG: Oligopeptide-binding protein OppA [Candidatus Anoxychlamydiales bacterium]|nr:Oligopeptide-binding protein OppA [Candidatus Anoxychlamydiales bacterium]
MKRIFFILMIFLLTACEKKPISQKTLRTRIYSDVSSLDTRRAGDYISSQVLFMLYRGLMHYSSTGALTNAICKSYEVSNDKKTYTFHLRKAFWSNGQKITANDFERSWKKILDPKFPAMYAELLYPIKNAEAAKSGKIDIEEVKITAKNKNTLIVELENPNPYFLFLTSFCTYFPMQEGANKKSADIANNFVSSGPFKIKKWDKNNQLILEKNPYFYDKDKINLDALYINVISNEDTAFQMYENGDVDFISSFLSPLTIETLAKVNKREDANIVPIGGFSFLCFNTEKYPFNNKNLRKAFSLAVDREAIVANITQLNEPIANRCIPPIFLEDRNKTLILNNRIDLAKKHFDEALKELDIGKDELKISFSFGSYIVHKKEAEALKQMWQKAFDIKVGLSQLEDKTHLTRLNQRDFQFALARLIVRYNDPLNIFERFKYKNHPKNYSNWEDEKFSQILDIAKREFNPEKRFRLIELAESMLLDDMPIAPLYFYNYTMLKKHYVKGIYTNIVGDLLFDETTILDRENL